MSVDPSLVHMTVSLSPVGEHLVALAAKIGDEFARPNAAAVDAEGRFPVEAIGALREARLLGAYLPVALGGEGATMADIVAIGHALGRRCSSTAMVFAMHQIQVACLAHHGLQVEATREFSSRVARDQLLLASATTETGVGGDVRSSLCSVEVDGGVARLSKDTPVISYADYADAILATARRNTNAPASDQVICIVERSDASLKQTTTWDTLGMRGTCSNGYLLEATFPADRIIALPYAEVSARTMLPVSHLTWAGLWLGIATDAFDRMRTFLRAQARKTPGSLPDAASDVASLHGKLDGVTSLLRVNLERYAAFGAIDALESTPPATFSLHMNALKTTVSVQVADIVRECLYVLGIAGYKNDSPYSVGRHLRDVLSAGIMVHNERIKTNSGALLCVVKEDLFPSGASR